MQQKNKLKFRFICGICLLIATAALGSIAYADDVAVIKIKYRRAEEVLPIVRSILSSSGNVSIEKRINSLVIIDNPAAIQRVRDYLAAVDKPVEQVRIRVRFYENQSDDRDSGSVEGQISGKDWSASTGGRSKDGVEVDLEAQKRGRTALSEYFVTTVCGSPAYIKTGLEIPYRENRRYYYRRHSKTQGPVTYKTIDSGFEVTPRIVGDHVDLKIVPRITYDNSDTGVIRFYGAQTQIMAPLGQWVEVGGIDGQQNEIFDEILSYSRGDKTVILSIALLVEKL